MRIPAPHWRQRRSRLLFATVAVAAIALFGNVAPGAAEPIPTPANDPFYAAPPNLGSFANGTIVNSREIVPFGLTVGLPVKTWQIQYKSEDGSGAPVTGMASVVVPTTPWTGPGARPLVSYQVAEDSLGLQCTTSYSIRAGLGAGVNNANTEAPIAALLLQRNWAVVFSDYQGPQQRFLDGLQTAHSVLDGIRAARAFGPAGLATSPLGALGYSGGAFATTWATEQQPTYAPELHFTGIAIGGVPADLGSALRTISGTYSAGLAMLLLSALDRIDPQAGIPGLLNDRGRAMLAENRTTCGVDFVTKYLFANLNDYTAEPNIGSNPTILALLDHGRLDRAIPAGPTYVWHSTGDDVLPIAGTDTLVRNWCNSGAQVTYVRTNAPTHSGAAYVGLPAAIDYLAQRFAGVPAPSGCV